MNSPSSNPLGSLKARYQLSGAGIRAFLFPLLGIVLMPLGLSGVGAMPPGEGIMFTVALLLISPFMWWFVTFTYIRNGPKILLYEHSIVEINKLKQTVIRWDEIDSVVYVLLMPNDSAFPRYPPIDQDTGREIFSPRGAKINFVIKGSSGEIEIGKHGAYKNMADLIKAIQLEFIEHRLPAYKSELETGKSLNFGNVDLVQIDGVKHIKIASRSAPISSIRRVLVQNYYLAFFSQVASDQHPLGRTPPLGWCYMADLLNLPILLAILAEHSITIEIGTGKNMPVEYQTAPQK